MAAIGYAKLPRWPGKIGVPRRPRPKSQPCRMSRSVTSVTMCC